MKKRKATVLMSAILIFGLAMTTVVFVSRSFSTSLVNYDRLESRTEQQISDVLGNDRSLRFLMYENA